MKKLLLHTCCGPCLIYPQEALGKDYDLTIFYYNPNIHPKEEYKKRLKTLKKYCCNKNFNLLVDEYTPANYFSKIKHKEKKECRCPECYRLRLTRTAEQAKRLGYKYFSTTLMVSPYQDLEKIIAIGKELAVKYDLEFITGEDWNKNFREAQVKAKELGMYRQKYCGCKFSLEEVQ